ncbi:RsmB/NOP family class I SAM-dependent RNA methyltransferase [Falcatimonas sp. MSJ-15]|uniref:RsmF rRNA methyltransferase first C-terminal domain-containing protein n=1 Tax=Falcatimonas sp. MSJ-15 TaxID=2841515 RepID=UPI001C1288E4|nr:RsmB/NOP family class I SAM-dependent RNA methyltransferase [Falcatimonas sp. MSJ-15]MBU5470320.1 RsmB/NOP family class I SAM-dependent RNA methyltransferase [Falcatimonas sp. MSJ-15]
MNLPKQFTDSMKVLLKDEYEDYIKSFEEPRIYGLRVNTSKISVEDFLKISPFKLRQIPWIENGFFYSEDDRPAKHPYYFAGLYYLQEPSAMTPANLLPVTPGERVLDLCAAPGGKSTELAAKLAGEGLLVSNDISATRAKALLKNLELFGISNMAVVCEMPQKLAEYFPEYFDKILIDAPCSGEGMFRKDNKLIKAWLSNGPEFYSNLQKTIVTEAVKMLKPGGLMIYSTCTFSMCEDEQQIQYILDQCPEMSVVPLEKKEGFCDGMYELAGTSKETKGCVRLFPHKIEGEGHFVALLKKDGELKEDLNGKRLESNVKKVPEEITEFLKHIYRDYNMDELQIFDTRAYIVPKELGSLKGLKYLRTGLLLGEIKKNRFEPSQALAMSLKMNEFDSVIDLNVDDARVIKYLKGETIDVDDIQTARDSGWQLVCVDGCPLGFGKLVNGTLKNKYLSGWRWQ